MNEHSLPEDLTRWPDNPYELLGVEHDIAPRDLKRSYTRLIRVYKPESHPEHFRRIREAYENVLRMIELFGGNIHFHVAESPPQPTPQPQPDAASTPQPSEQSDNSTNPPVAERQDYNEIPPLSDEVVTWTGTNTLAEPTSPEETRDYWIDDAEQLWQKAIHGEEAEAYHGMRRLHERQSNRTEHCLRLYWLLTLNPEADPDRHPCDWLMTAFRTSGLRGPALELYRREIEANPQEAVHARFEELLNGGAPQNTLVDLYSWRWMALRKWLGWDVLAADWPIARQRLFGVDESLWLRLLGIAADAAAWIELNHPCRGVWDDIEKEVKHLAHLGTRHEHWFDQFDVLVATRGQWHPACRQLGMPCALLELIRASWNAPPSDYRAILETILEEIIENPRLCLSQMTEVSKKYPAVMAAFGAVIAQHEHQSGRQLPRPSADSINLLTRTFVGGMLNQGEFLRQAVADYCCREAIDPAWMVEALIEGRVDWCSPLDPQPFVNLAQDWPLRYLLSGESVVLGMIRFPN